MRLSSLWRGLTLAPALVGGVALADAPQNHRLTEAAFLEALDEQHPAFQALTDRLGAARADQSQAGVLINPTFGVEYEAPEGTTHQTTWTVAWTPPLDGRRGLRVRASQEAAEAARLELEAERLALRMRLRAVYARWAVAHERSAVIGSHVQFIQQLAAQMRARAAAGEASGLAARRFALARLEVESQLALAEAEELQARSDAIGWRSGLPPEAMPAMPPLPEVRPEMSFTGRPDLEARKHDVAAAKAQASLARRVFAFPELGVGWQQQDDEGQDFEGPTYALSWDVPIFDRQQADRIEADSRLAAAEARLEHATARASAEFEGARAAYERVRSSALEVADGVKDTDAIIESTASSYRLGEASVTDLLETLSSVLDSRVAALELYDAALAAHRHLEAAAGHPLTAGTGE
jgi:cobalt-zinc-cadmium efflux system outer membrane protein